VIADALAAAAEWILSQPRFIGDLNGSSGG